MENNLIEKINIAELDPSKTYFMQISCSYISAEQMQNVFQYLEDKFNEYNIKNIVLYTPSDMKIEFTEVQ